MWLLVLAAGGAMGYGVVPLGRAIDECDEVIEEARDALKDHRRDIIIRLDVIDEQETWLMSVEMSYLARRDELVRRWWSCVICGPLLALLGLGGLSHGLYRSLAGGSKPKKRRRRRAKKAGARTRPTVRTRGGPSRRP